ncbi:glycoside hydrolase [Dacryopinax primogenitus]|uniref:Glycoside hydrolase n=1 Tax=Dacryopinax primogenitus (strain DJM 731) TaxID=1858805 RepID=M5FUJ9_DACPD|nr:glycoside hydrolase [Dacryopinax primogenitus]EJT96926.1 glycoside hydrolase [Dacryopinax primogenitus]
MNSRMSLLIALLGSLPFTLGLPQSTVSTTAPTSVLFPLPKLVVAHVIVGNTQPYSVSDWSNDIALAQKAGIDAFALNYGSPGWEPGQLSNVYQAALSHSGFKLFLSADMTSLSGGSQGDAQNLANQVKQFVNHPAQLTYGGKTLLGTFSGEYSTFGQGSIEAGWKMVLNLIGSPVAFFPAWFVDPSTFGQYPVLSGALNWNGAWPMGSTDLTFDSDSQWIRGLGAKAYMAPVSPNFFTHYGPNTYNKNWIYRSDDSLYATRWETLISNRNSVAIAQIITWNDYGESHYIGPIKGDESMANAWVDGYDHTPWLTMTNYYATAFKTGRYPSITQDQVYIYARPHPKAANAQNDGVGRPNNWQNTDDNFYVTVFATSPAQVVLSTPNRGSKPNPPASGPNAQTFNIRAGVSHLKLALQPGNCMRATLMRSNRVVVDVYPTGYFFNPNPPTFNFNVFVHRAST